MSTSEFDGVRPPSTGGRRKGARRKGGGGGHGGHGGHNGGADGSREMPMVPEAEFTSYYGRPVVKAPPWGHEIPAYLFLGGLAAGSGMIAAGAQFSKRPKLRRNSRLGAMAAVGLGSVALVLDLGRPERFLNMLRTIKVTSPMSIGSWILSLYAAGAGVTTAIEVDKMTGQRFPLGPVRRLLPFVEVGAGLWAAAFAPPLAAYTAVLLGDTANPTWNDAREELPFVFVSSATLASGGLAMVTTPVAEAGPARALAVIGAAVETVATQVMHRRMDPTIAETMHHGPAGKMLKAAEICTIAGGLGALLSGKHRAIAVVSGVTLMAASALTRFGVFDAGMHSVKDPKYTIEPQKRRLAARRAAGITDDSITTVG